MSSDIVKRDYTPPPGMTLVQAALLYIPNTKLSAICGAVYVAAGLCHMWHIWRRRDWWALCLPLGTICYAVGFFVRIGMVNGHQDDKGWLIAQAIFIACAPAAFLAFNYLVYGRLVVRCIGASHSYIRPTLVAKLFVASDVVTILVQAAGSAMTATVDKAKTGAHIFLTGLVLQALSYTLFVMLLVSTLVRARKHSTGKEVWWPAAWLVCASSVPVMIRCIFRCIQVGIGRKNELSTNELYFYVLDALMLWLAIAIYIPFWPEKWIVAHTEGSKEQYKLSEPSHKEQTGSEV